MINKGIKTIVELGNTKAFDRRKLDFADYIQELSREKTLNKRPQFLVSIDDISMVPQGIMNFDRGKTKNGILEKILKMTHKWGWFRPIFFIVPYNSEVLNGRNIFYSRNITRSINHPSNHYRIEMIRDAVSKNLISVGMHGLHHNQRNIIGYHPYAEFEFSTLEEDLTKLLLMAESFENAGLNSNLFKPPAFGIGAFKSKDLLSVINKIESVEYVFLSTPNNGMNMRRYAVSHVNDTYFDSLINVPQNINLLWTHEVIEKVITEICKVNGCIHPQFHAVSPKALDDGVSELMFRKLEFCWEVANKITGERIDVRTF